LREQRVFALSLKQRIRRKRYSQVLYRGRPKKEMDLAAICTTPYAETLFKEKDGEHKPFPVLMTFHEQPVRE